VPVLSFEFDGETRERERQLRKNASALSTDCNSSYPPGTVSFQPEDQRKLPIRADSGRSVAEKPDKIAAAVA